MGFWDSVKEGVSTVGRVSGVTPAFELATQGKLSDDSKDFYTFGGETRKRRADEQQGQAAQAAADHRKALDDSYDKYRQSYTGAEGAFSQQMSGLDTQSKESMDNYRRERNNLDAQADNTRQGLFNQQSSYLNEGVQNVNKITDQYVNTATNLTNQASQQATDAKSTYTNTVRPNLMTNLDNARNFENTVSKQAMSLADSMDQNNAVASQMRGMYTGLADQMVGRYDTMSQQERGDLEGLMQRGVSGIDQEVAGTRQRGLADVGVLNALGAQATGLMGGSGMPMTGSQLAALSAQQGAQSSEAYAQAQQRMRSLEDQKRAYQMQSLDKMGDRASDLRRGSLDTEGALRTTGIGKGQEASTQAYDRGYTARTEAMDRTSNRLAQLMGGESDINALLGNLRGEQSQYGRDIYGAKGSAEGHRQNVADTLFGSRSAIEEGKISRGYGNKAQDLQFIQQSLGIDRAAAERLMQSQTNLAGLDYNQQREQAGLAQSATTNNIQMQQAQQQQTLQMLMGAMGLGGQVAGAYFGGPGMAAAPIAGAAAQGAARGFSPWQSNAQPQQYQSYPFFDQMGQGGYGSRYGNTMVS